MLPVGWSFQKPNLSLAVLTRGQVYVYSVERRYPCAKSRRHPGSYMPFEPAAQYSQNTLSPILDSLGGDFALLLLDGNALVKISWLRSESGVDLPIFNP